MCNTFCTKGEKNVILKSNNQFAFPRIYNGKPQRKSKIKANFLIDKNSVG
jgi:hypothetical protein